MIEKLNTKIKGCFKNPLKGAMNDVIRNIQQDLVGFENLLGLKITDKAI